MRSKWLRRTGQLSNMRALKPPEYLRCRMCGVEHLYILGIVVLHSESLGQHEARFVDFDSRSELAIR